MSNQLSTFNFESNSIRTLVINNEPWFVAKDICDILGIKNPTQALENLDDDERAMFNVGLNQRVNFDNRITEINIVSESGMYTLILRCREAVKKGSIPYRFRKWVTNEVLPTIRKTGNYTTPTQATIAYEPKTHEVEDEVLHTLSNLLFLAHRQADVLAKLYPALKTMLSQYAAEVYSLYTEPGLSISLSEHRLRKLFTTLAKDDAEWRKTLHHFNEMFPIEKYNARLSRQQALHAIGR
ncbi:BRO family protein [Pelistega ratti]|uniref:BRO family protein n=1 Tax=Pelistega ratti TaxID=2652177 RepID=UPI00135ABE46|nr:BRO family protein [Pelistega ratti]